MAFMKLKFWFLFLDTSITSKLGGCCFQFWLSSSPNFLFNVSCFFVIISALFQMFHIVLYSFHGRLNAISKFYNAHIDSISFIFDLEWLELNCSNSSLLLNLHMMKLYSRKLLSCNLQLQSTTQLLCSSVPCLAVTQLRCVWWMVDSEDWRCEERYRRIGKASSTIAVQPRIHVLLWVFHLSAGLKDGASSEQSSAVE